MRKKTDPFLENWIDILVEKVLQEQEPEQAASNSSKTKPTNAAEIGIPNDSGISPSPSASPKTGPETTPESEIPGSNSLPADSSEIDAGGEISANGGGGGGFIGPGLGGGGGSGGGGLSTDPGPPDDSLVQGEPEESEVEGAQIDPKEQFKQDFTTLISSTKEIEEIKKFLKASLQDKNEVERNDWLSSLDNQNDPVIQKATKDLKKFFS